MKKNGFIATSILYSFFLVFITLFVALITNYLHNQVLLTAIDDLAWETLYSINNTKFSDLEVGEHVRFANNPASRYSFSLNPNANWVVADIVTSGNIKTYYLLSDFSAQSQVVTRKMPRDPISVRHFVTIDVMNYLSNPTYNDGYIDDIYFYAGSGAFSSRNDFKVYIPRASVLAKVRDSALTDDIKDEILGVEGDYAVYIDSGQAGFPSGSYALLRRYNFAMGVAQADWVNSYCASTYDGTKVTYTGKNTPANKGFGYTHVVSESVNTTGTLRSYVDYCTYASVDNYFHDARHNVVDVNESKNDRILETFRATTYQYRLMAEIRVDVNSEKTYIAGGRGTSIDPYLMTNGVKQE